MALMRRKFPGDIQDEMKKKWIQFRRANQSKIYEDHTYTHQFLLMTKSS